MIEIVVTILTFDRRRTMACIFNRRPLPDQAVEVDRQGHQPSQAGALAREPLGSSSEPDGLAALRLGDDVDGASGVVPARRTPGLGLPRDLARAEGVERGRHPGPIGRAVRDLTGLAGEPDQAHSRYLEGTVGEVRVGCLYLPNRNPARGPKFNYKLRKPSPNPCTARAGTLIFRPRSFAT